MKDVDEVAALVAKKFAEALDQVSRAMKFLIANGVVPHEKHQAIAFAWARGEVDDETFLKMARFTSWMEDEGDKPE